MFSKIIILHFDFEMCVSVCIMKTKTYSLLAVFVFICYIQMLQTLILLYYLYICISFTFAKFIHRAFCHTSIPVFISQNTVHFLYDHRIGFEFCSSYLRNIIAHTKSMYTQFRNEWNEQCEKCESFIYFAYVCKFCIIL